MRLTKVLRDNKKDLPTNLSVGELVFANDTEELFVGQGVGNQLKKVNELNML